MTFLSTRYLGLELRTPLVASAGPLSQTVDGVKALADAGVGAVVMYSLFEEQIRADEARSVNIELDIDDAFAEATSYFPVVPRTGTHVDPESAAYLKLLSDAAGIQGKSTVLVWLRKHGRHSWGSASSRLPMTVPIKKSSTV